MIGWNRAMGGVKLEISSLEGLLGGEREIGEEGAGLEVLWVSLRGTFDPS
jgi:hypothetical protein